MTGHAPRIAIFGMVAGIGTTTLVYHLAHTLADLGKEVLVVDVDPQAALTARCLSSERLEELWNADMEDRNTVWGTGPPIEELASGLALIPSDGTLAPFEGHLANAWPRALMGEESALRTLSSLHHLVSRGIAESKADIVLIHLGPGISAINRAALLGVDPIVSILTPDLFSVRGIPILDAALTDWRKRWQNRRKSSSLGASEEALTFPVGRRNIDSYIISQSGMRLRNPVQSYARWMRQIPEAFNDLAAGDALVLPGSSTIPQRLATMRNYPSLAPLAHAARKPMFKLKPGDGAIGAHTRAVARCRTEFQTMAQRLLTRI